MYEKVYAPKISYILFSTSWPTDQFFNLHFFHWHILWNTCNKIVRYVVYIYCILFAGSVDLTVNGSAKSINIR